MISFTATPLPVATAHCPQYALLKAAATCDACERKQDFEGKIRLEDATEDFVTIIFRNNHWRIGNGKVVCANC